MPKPIAYGYARASHIDNMGSIPAQIDRITDYFKRILSETCEFAGVISDDKPVSASKLPFPKRPAGKKLLEQMRPGDHIIFDKIDRIWRSVSDFVNLTEYFRNQKITVHIIDFRGCTVAMNTPMGDFMLNLMVAIAELESKTTGVRIKEAFEQMRRNREYAHGAASVMYGCKIMFGPDGKRRLVWNEKQRDKMAEVVRLVDEEGKTFAEVDKLIGPFSNCVSAKMGVHRLYRREKMLTALNITDPMDIPRGISLLQLEGLFGGKKACSDLEEDRKKYLEIGR